MSQTVATDPARRLEEAFQALAAYDWGSPRGVLLPIDEAVRNAGYDRKQARALEQRLVQALQAGGSLARQQYLCSKLALIGTDRCVPALAALLDQPELATAACDALEKIPGSAPGRALRAGLKKVSGRQKAAVVRALGVRRDRAGISPLAKCLADPDPAVAARAAEALGEIGTARCAEALKNVYRRKGPAANPALAGALLACAERLAQARQNREARRIYELLVHSAEAAHIRDAARLGLQPTA